MKRSMWWWVLLVVLVGAGAFLYHQQAGRQSEAPPPPAPGSSSPPAPQPQAPSEPLVRHPVPAAQPSSPGEKTPQSAPPPEPLPSLADSDPVLRKDLLDLFGDALARHFDLTRIVRRAVVTVDNLPRSKLPQKYVPYKPVPGQFQVAGPEGGRYIDPRNYQRYTPYVRLLEAVDLKRLVSLYFHFYPLFQQAYRQLGYPSGYFNDRLVEAIDDLLAAPRPRGPIKLVRPHVLYKFADPHLEGLSAGQKLLIRMGPDNEARVKARLRALRRALTDQRPVNHAPTDSSGD